MYHAILSPLQNHPAENLLSLDTYRKWQCSTEGEKQAVVVLEVNVMEQSLVDKDFSNT